MLAPREIAARRAAGTLNRYEAAVQYAHHCESLPGEELAASLYPTWADGRVAKITALRVLAAAGGLEAERILDEAATTEEDIGLRALAADAHDAIERRRGGAQAVERRRAPALGHLGAIPALRRAVLAIVPDVAENKALIKAARKAAS